jgi:hypothetical protein
LSHDPTADEYRRRAAELRRLAAQLEQSPVLRLHGDADAETWSSPGADACRATLSEDQARLRHAADELSQQAFWYEHQAAALDAVAAARGLTPGG